MGKTENMACPVCKRVHDVDVMADRRMVLEGGIIYEYDEIVCRCALSARPDCIFVPVHICKKNNLNKYMAMRKAQGFLTPEDIKAFREKYLLSQEEFEVLMGWKEGTAKTLETYGNQTVKVDKALKAMISSSFERLEQLERTKNDWPSDRYNATRVLFDT